MCHKSEKFDLFLTPGSLCLTRRFNELAMLLATMALLGSGCKKNKWVKGQWLHIDENGKPGMCHQFGDEQQFNVYRSTKCEGPPDPVLSGKWQLKQDNRLAVLRTGEGQARLALINEHDDARFVSRGALTGSFHRLGAKDPEALIRKLSEKGVVEVRRLAEQDGCNQLNTAVAKIRALPIEKSPRMLRNRDQGLEYHANTSTGDPRIEKIVYAINQDQLDWIAFHLTAAAFEAPGPTASLEAKIGSPLDTLTTGKDDTRQHIVMWRAYCTDVRGSFNKDVDITLFATPGQRQGLYYLSDGIISGLWEDLKHTVSTADDPEDEAQEDAE